MNAATKDSNQLRSERFRSLEHCIMNLVLSGNTTWDRHISIQFPKLLQIHRALVEYYKNWFPRPGSPRALEFGEYVETLSIHYSELHTLLHLSEPEPAALDEDNNVSPTISLPAARLSQILGRIFGQRIHTHTFAQIRADFTAEWLSARTAGRHKEARRIGIQANVHLLIAALNVVINKLNYFLNPLY